MRKVQNKNGRETVKWKIDGKTLKTKIGGKTKNWQIKNGRDTTKMKNGRKKVTNKRGQKNYKKTHRKISVELPIKNWRKDSKNVNGWVPNLKTCKKTAKMKNGCKNCLVFHA